LPRSAAATGRSAGAGCRRHRVDHSGQGLAAGRTRHHGPAGLAICLRRHLSRWKRPRNPGNSWRKRRVLVVRLREGKDQSYEQTFVDDWIFAITVRDGRLDQHPGIRRHPSTGPGLADGRRPACVALALCSRRLGRRWISCGLPLAHAASSSFAPTVGRFRCTTNLSYPN